MAFGKSLTCSMLFLHSKPFLGALGMLPLAIVFSRRPVFRSAIVIAMCAIIGAATSKDFNGHFVSRIFLGLATGATESVRKSMNRDL